MESVDEVTTRLGSKSSSRRLMAKVRATGVPLVREARQGDATVCGLGYFMGDRCPRAEPMFFNRGLYGVLYARRLPGQELWLGVGLFATQELAEAFSASKQRQAWTIYIETWRGSAAEPIRRVA